MFTIDLNSTALTVKLLGVVNTPDVAAHSISGLAFANDVLYATQWNGQRDALFTINTADLSIGNIYYLPSPVNYNVSDLASPYHPGSPLGLHSSSNIFEIKSPTGPISIIGNASIPSVQYGLAYAPDRNMMYTTGSDRIVWEINPLTMSSRVVASPFGGGLAALEYVPYAPVPEPATQALFAVGIVLLGAGALRKSQARNLLHPSNDRSNDA